jgi:hypothetical protein
MAIVHPVKWSITSAFIVAASCATSALLSASPQGVFLGYRFPLAFGLGFGVVQYFALRKRRANLPPPPVSSKRD